MLIILGDEMSSKTFKYVVNSHQIKLRLNSALIFTITTTSKGQLALLEGCLFLLGTIVIVLHSFLAQYFEPLIVYIFSFLVEIVGNGSGRCEKVQKRYRSLYSSGLSIYRMTRPHWPLRHRADSGLGLSGFPILPLREYPAHTKVKDRESKSRRPKESKKERLSTKVKRDRLGIKQDASKEKTIKLTAPGPCCDPLQP